jgi:tetratricopeptide (TPR) repeat protein
MVAWFKCGAGKNSKKLAEHKGSEIAVTGPNGDSQNKDQSEDLKMGEEPKKEASNTLDGYSEEDAKEEGNPAKIIVDGEERMFPPPPPDFFEKYTFLPEDNEGNSKPMPNEIEDPQMAKDLGVECFKEGNLDLAIAYWRQGLKKCLSALCSGGPDAMHNKSLSDIDLKCNLNIAMAEIKRENYQSAVDHCDKALRRRDMLDPEDLVKVLYRKAVAFDKMGKYVFQFPSLNNSKYQNNLTAHSTYNRTLHPVVVVTGRVV